jgi:cyclic pyranopterin phosphate synthase
VTFSLDSLDRANFKKMTGRDGLREVLQAISFAQELGFSPVKVNAVVIRGINDHEIGSLAAFAREGNLSLRFIEFMPLDSARAWQKEMVVTGREILDRLHKNFGGNAGGETPAEQSAINHTLIPVASDNKSETAKRWVFADGRAEIGVIAPVSEPFCGHCNRVRLTADGKIRTCLFSITEHDLRSRLRNGATDAEVGQWLQEIVWGKEARHHIGEPEFVAPPRSMSCIGG